MFNTRFALHFITLYYSMLMRIVYTCHACFLCHAGCPHILSENVGTAGMLCRDKVSLSSPERSHSNTVTCTLAELSRNSQHTCTLCLNSLRIIHAYVVVHVTATGYAHNIIQVTTSTWSPLPIDVFASKFSAIHDHARVQSLLCSRITICCCDTYRHDYVNWSRILLK